MRLKQEVAIKVRIATPHRVVGCVSLLVGLSFLFERYQLVSRALATPFSLLEWVPVVTGQQVWGLCFTFGGLLILTSFNIYIRLVSLSFGALSWAALCVPSLYEAYLGPQRHETGGFAGLVSLSILSLCIVAARRLHEDFSPYSAKVTS